MKKKKLLLMLSSLLLVSPLAGCSGGTPSSLNNGATIPVDFSYKLYEYDVKTETQGNEVTNLVIECSKRYKLAFDADFDTNILPKLNDEVVETTITVTLGELDNKENMQLISEKRHTGGGPVFEATNTNTYTATFNLSKDTKKDNLKLSSSYFIVGTDSLKSDTNAPFTPVEISFKCTNDKYRLLSGGNFEKYGLTLCGKKTTYNWSKSNLSNITNSDLPRDTIRAEIPLAAGSLKISVYSDETKTTYYGTKTYTNDLFASDNSLNIDIVSDIKGMIGIKQWAAIAQKNGNKFPAYIEFELPENMNYLSSSFGESYSFDL